MFFLLCFAFVLHLFHNFKFLFSFFCFTNIRFRINEGKKMKSKNWLRDDRGLKIVVGCFFFFPGRFIFRYQSFGCRFVFLFLRSLRHRHRCRFFFFFDFVSKGCRSFFFFGFCCRLYNECKKEGRTGSGKPFS